MPIDYSEYPSLWPEIRARILARAGDRCECTGECELWAPGRRSGSSTIYSGRKREVRGY